MSSSNLAAFSNWLGLLIVGFKAEILAFLSKMKVRKEVRDREGGKKRKHTPSKFERKLKKLECFVNYKRTEGKRSANWEIAAVGTCKVKRGEEDYLGLG